MVVQHNLTAMNANRYLGINNSKLGKSLEKLSSGYAINKAGDNAAGLAVSEKMRSQIAGMTQGVKNAQDGISMVQTFEGALTETHSILQRMKTLADQMGNDSYDDPVDRTAAQQEFLQLNDELNQIADTDFNGVVVLNGGVMADGLEQVDGKFDYANKASQVAEKQAAALAEAQAKAQENIDAAQKAYDTALNRYQTVTSRDQCVNGTAANWNSVDNSQYDKTAADALFDIDGKTAGTSLADEGIESIDITYEATKAADGTVTWAIKGGSYVDGEGTKQNIDASKLTPVISKVQETDNGGFIAGTTTSAPVAGQSVNASYGNVVMNSTDVKTGDQVTLTYTHSASATQAPSNIGIAHDTLVNNVDNSVPTLELLVTDDDDMNEETAAALDKLNGAKVDFEYSATGIKASISDDSLKLTQDATDLGKFTISYTNGKGNDVKLATITTTAPAGDSTKLTASTTGLTAADTVNAAVDAKITYIKDADGNEGWSSNGTAILGATDTIALANRTMTTGNLSVAGGTPRVGDEISIKLANGGKLGDLELTYKGQAATLDSMNFTIALDNGAYDPDGEKPTINPSISPDVTNSVEIDKKYEETKAALAAAKAAYPKSVDDLPEEYKVSKSDAFDNSEAIMTYKDQMILQVGARTKDAVNFTFQYNSDAIGDLEADLNCTAKGLGTDKLNLNTQEDANYAIDKIDQAINKVSLIRGTFGAIQNRLEHKIDNMNVSIENLTSAESAIRDTNMPQEMMNFTKQQILAQASQSMLAQANQLPQGVLSLLQ